jgi:hypothetical protein
VAGEIDDLVGRHRQGVARARAMRFPSMKRPPFLISRRYSASRSFTQPTVATARLGLSGAPLVLG